MSKTVRSATRSLTAVVLSGFCMLLGSVAAVAESPPDLTGIWGMNRSLNRPAIAPRPWPENPPLRPEAKAKIDEYRKLVEPNGDTPGAFCLGAGMPASMLGSGAYPMEIIQRPEQITIIYEAHTEMRRIYMDGRKLAPDELIPSRNGFSTGRWEGDTLVVETIGLKEAVDQMSAHSDQATIVERYRVSGKKGERVLTAELTLTDPVFYTKPVTVTKTWYEMKDGRMMFYECNEPAWEDHIEKLRQQAAQKTAAAGK